MGGVLIGVVATLLFFAPRVRVCADTQQPIAKSVPMYVSGSADLHGSNKNYIADGGDFGVNLGKRYAHYVCRVCCLLYFFFSM